MKQKYIKELGKSWSMCVAVVPVVIRVLGAASKWLEIKDGENWNLGEKLKINQTIALMKITKICRGG